MVEYFYTRTGTPEEHEALRKEREARGNTVTQEGVISHIKGTNMKSKALLGREGLVCFTSGGLRVRVPPTQSDTIEREGV